MIARIPMLGAPASRQTHMGVRPIRTRIRSSADRRKDDMYGFRPWTVAAIAGLVALIACQGQQPAAVVVTPRPGPTIAPATVASAPVTSVASVPATGQPGQA